MQSSHQAGPRTVSPLALTPLWSRLRNRSIGPRQAIGPIGQIAQSLNRAQDPIVPIGEFSNRPIGPVLQLCNRDLHPIAQSLTRSNLSIGHPGTFAANRSNRAQSVLQRCNKLAATPSHHIFSMQIQLGSRLCLSLSSKLHAIGHKHRNDCVLDCWTHETRTQRTSQSGSTTIERAQLFAITDHNSVREMTR